MAQLRYPVILSDAPSQLIKTALDLKAEAIHIDTKGSNIEMNNNASQDLIDNMKIILEAMEAVGGSPENFQSLRNNYFSHLDRLIAVSGSNIPIDSVVIGMNLSLQANESKKYSEYARAFQACKKLRPEKKSHNFQIGFDAGSGSRSGVTGVVIGYGSKSASAEIKYGADSEGKTGFTYDLGGTVAGFGASISLTPKERIFGLSHSRLRGILAPSLEIDGGSTLSLGPLKLLKRGGAGFSFSPLTFLAGRALSYFGPGRLRSQIKKVKRDKAEAIAEIKNIEERINDPNSRKQESTNPNEPDWSNPAVSGLRMAEASFANSTQIKSMKGSVKSLFTGNYYVTENTTTVLRDVMSNFNPNGSITGASPVFAAGHAAKFRVDLNGNDDKENAFRTQAAQAYALGLGIMVLSEWELVKGNSGKFNAKRVFGEEAHKVAQKLNGMVGTDSLFSISQSGCLDVDFQKFYEEHSQVQQLLMKQQQIFKNAYARWVKNYDSLTPTEKTQLETINTELEKHLMFMAAAETLQSSRRDLMLYVHCRDWKSSSDDDAQNLVKLQNDFLSGEVSALPAKQKFNTSLEIFSNYLSIQSAKSIGAAVPGSDPNGLSSGSALFDKYAKMTPEGMEKVLRDSLGTVITSMLRHKNANDQDLIEALKSLGVVPGEGLIVQLNNIMDSINPILAEYNRTGIKALNPQLRDEIEALNRLQRYCGIALSPKRMDLMKLLQSKLKEPAQANSV